MVLGKILSNLSIKKDYFKELSFVGEKKSIHKEPFVFVKKNGEKLPLELTYNLNSRLYSNDLNTLHFLFGVMKDVESSVKDEELEKVLLHLAVDANNDLSLDFKNCSAYKLFSYSRNPSLNKTVITANLGYNSLSNNYNLQSPLRKVFERNFTSFNFDFENVTQMSVSKVVGRHKRRMKTFSPLPSDKSVVFSVYNALLDYGKLMIK